MPLTHFTVSQVRVAAACPRILYFDAVHTRVQKLKQPSVTRIWKAGRGNEGAACGSLFHAAVERFNETARANAAVRRILESAVDSSALAQELVAHVYQHHVNRKALFTKPGPHQEAFLSALRRYFAELADILIHARTLGKPLSEVLEELFGDRRRRVDVTFEVGAAGEPVHVTGILDYVFYDWRTAHQRIIDYKLTAADKPTNDLFQVGIYALMHHVQHRTEPDVGVLYLHPQRHMVEAGWPQIHGQRHVVFNLLASMRLWIAYDEKTGEGLKPPGEPLYCDVCRWNRQCVRRLGPKHEGGRLEHWIETSPDPVAPKPQTEARRPDSAGNSTRTAKSESPPADMLWLGRFVDNEEAIGLPTAALPTHVAVVGAAGSGKTWVAKALTEEAVRQGVPVLAIDPQGDLVQLLKPRAIAEFTDEQRPAYEAFWHRVEPHIWTPGSSHADRICLSPIHLPRCGDLADLEESRRKEEVDNLLTSVAGNLVNLARAGGDSDCQRAFLFQVLGRLAEGEHRNRVELTDVATAVAEPDALGLDQPDLLIKKSERQKLARKLNALLAGPAVRLFAGGRPLDLAEMLRPSRPGKTPLHILYLNALPDEEQKQFFVASVATEIYRWMVTAGNLTGRAQLLFYLDEARDYIPAGARKPPAKEPLLRLFAQGRKYGVACLLCTQSARSVDYNVFGNCSTKIVGRLESSQDVDRVAEWFQGDGAAPTWLAGRKGAERGTFIARWPDMPAVIQDRPWRSRLLYSVHEGAWSPEQLEREWHIGS
jgi:CRISPR/Cas system-associated exonuclease Cas4 (RecB family)